MLFYVLFLSIVLFYVFFLSFVLFYVLSVCKCTVLLSSGVYPIEVKYISYHIISLYVQYIACLVSASIILHDRHRVLEHKYLMKYEKKVS